MSPLRDGAVDGSDRGSWLDWVANNAQINLRQGGLVAQRDVVELPDAGDELGLASQQFTCANPRCDEQFQRRPGPGRRREFHDEDCRRDGERDLRRTAALLEHHERQAEQLRARAAAYLRTTLDEGDTPSRALTEEQRRVAADAVAEVRGMSRFLENHEGEFAPDLLKLYRAVAPLVS